MSRIAKDRARKLKRTPDATRMIICEQVFDVRIGDLVVIAFHPKSKTHLPILRELLPDRDSREFNLALKKAIWKEAIKHIPGNTEHTEKAPEARMPMHQPALL